MPDLIAEIADEVLAACTAGAEKAAEAFGRAFDTKVTLSVGQLGTLDPQNLPRGLEGPGLAVVWTVGSRGALALLPESSGLVPEWCKHLDPTGPGKLTTLAEELGMLVMPEQFRPQDAAAARVENLAEALRRGGVGEGAGVVPLELSADDLSGVARVIWPVPDPAAVLQGATQPGASAQSEPAPPARPNPAAGAAANPKARPARYSARLRELPDYSRSLLRIKVPVVVTLARKRQPVSRIVELGAGSIIQFDKSCEEMLEMSVGGHPVAAGEAVKVGDKFGLRITSMILPDERFQPVRPQ
jgi:flagellar motor switch protein FliN/FliY